MEFEVVIRLLPIIVLIWISFLICRALTNMVSMEKLLKQENNEVYLSIGSPVWGQPTRDKTRSGLVVLLWDEIDGVGSNFLSKRSIVLRSFRKAKFLSMILIGIVIIMYVFSI